MTSRDEALKYYWTWNRTNTAGKSVIKPDTPLLAEKEGFVEGFVQGCAAMEARIVEIADSDPDLAGACKGCHKVAVTKIGYVNVVDKTSPDFAAGYSNGHKVGLAEAKNERHAGFQEGYAEGVASEQQKQIMAGKNSTAYQAGYDDGRAESVQAQNNSCAKKATPDYACLATVLHEAIEQAQSGKGKERHASGEPFDQQPICSIARQVGLGYPLGQAAKKIFESTRLSLEAGVIELLGAINYLAAAVIILRERGKMRNESN